MARTRCGCAGSEIAYIRTHVCRDAGGVQATRSGSATLARAVTPAAPGPCSGSWGVVAACPRAWDCAGFAGGAFGASNDRARWQAVGSSHPARRAAAARSQAWRWLRADHDRGEDPLSVRARASLISVAAGYFLTVPPPLRHLHLDGGRGPPVTSTSDSLDIRSLSAAWRCPERAPGQLLRPPPFLPDLGRVCQETVVCLAGAGRWRYRGPRHPWSTRKRSKRGKGQAVSGDDEAVAAISGESTGLPVNRRSPKGCAIYGNRRFGGFWRFGAKTGNRRFWPIWWQSPIWVMPADLPIKLVSVVWPICS
jgi:hypothetical protein